MLPSPANKILLHPVKMNQSSSSEISSLESGWSADKQYLLWEEKRSCFSKWPSAPSIETKCGPRQRGRPRRELYLSRFSLGDHLCDKKNTSFILRQTKMSKQFQKMISWHKLTSCKFIRKHAHHKRSNSHQSTDIFSYFSTYSLTWWIWQ